jgi:hypothetical protein
MAMINVSKFSASIHFVSKVKKLDKVDGTDSDRSEWIELDFLMHPDIPVSKYS